MASNVITSGVFYALYVSAFLRKEILSADRQILEGARNLEQK